MKSFPIAIMALVLELLFLLLSQARVRLDAPGAIRLMMLASLVYLFSAVYAFRCKLPIPKVFLIVSAVLFRLTLAPTAPALSDDVYRYRWEGRVQSQGLNPYLVSPAETERDATYPLIPTREVRSGYGPLASLTEWVSFEMAVRITPDPFGQAFWMKLPSVASEAATLLLLSRALPASRLIVYAWCPIPIVEFWWNGHNDAMAVFWVVAALLAARRDGQAWGGAAHAALGLAIAFKWWPGILWPLLLAKGFSRWWRMAWIAPAVVLASTLPYWTSEWRQMITNARYMSGYVGGWRNNDSLFGVLLALTGDQYLAKYAAFALLGASIGWMIVRRWSLERSALGTVVVTLLVSANCHPWYLSWLVPLAALVPWPPLLVWQLLMPLAYLVLVEWHARGIWVGSRPDRWWIYGPVFAAITAWAAVTLNNSRRREEAQPNAITTFPK
jgi:hypothetical protein